MVFTAEEADKELHEGSREEAPLNDGEDSEAKTAENQDNQENQENQENQTPKERVKIGIIYQLNINHAYVIV